MSRVITLDNSHGRAQISSLGATVLSWIPKGQVDALWLSPEARFRTGRAIRGGIPVCWPWFASDPAHPQGPAHGLVRTAEWTVDHVDASSTRLSIGVEAPDFPPFRLVLEVRLGAGLALRLTHHNLSDRDVGCTGALHAYFRAHAPSASVRGLGDARAFDKVAGVERTLADPIRFEGPTDLVIGSHRLAVLHDGERRIEVHRHDAPDVVLWNPGDALPSDVPAGGPAQFVCVEAAAVRDPWVVPARGQRTFGMELRQPHTQ